MRYMEVKVIFHKLQMENIKPLMDINGNMTIFWSLKNDFCNLVFS